MLILHFLLVISYCTAELKDIIGYHNVSQDKVREKGGMRKGDVGLMCGQCACM